MYIYIYRFLQKRKRNETLDWQGCLYGGFSLLLYKKNSYSIPFSLALPLDTCSRCPTNVLNSSWLATSHVFGFGFSKKVSHSTSVYTLVKKMRNPFGCDIASEYNDEPPIIHKDEWGGAVSWQVAEEGWGDTRDGDGQKNSKASSKERKQYVSLVGSWVVLVASRLLSRADPVDGIKWWRLSTTDLQKSLSRDRTTEILSLNGLYFNGTEFQVFRPIMTTFGCWLSRRFKCLVRTSKWAMSVGSFQGKRPWIPMPPDGVAAAMRESNGCLAAFIFWMRYLSWHDASAKHEMHSADARMTIAITTSLVAALLHNHVKIQSGRDITCQCRMQGHLPS